MNDNCQYPLYMSVLIKFILVSKLALTAVEVGLINFLTCVFSSTKRTLSYTSMNTREVEYMIGRGHRDGGPTAHLFLFERELSLLSRAPRRE